MIIIVIRLGQARLRLPQGLLLAQRVARVGRHLKKCAKPRNYTYIYYTYTYTYVCTYTYTYMRIRIHILY